MVVGLVPYRWVTDQGMPCWALPVGATSSIDLRRLDQITNTAATGYAIATYPTSLPTGSVALSSGSVAVRRSAWQSTLGYFPQGNTPEEWVLDHLLNGADDTFAASCRPLRCIGPDRVEMHLGGQRFERQLNAPERLQQAVFVRRDLDEIFDDVEAGRLPSGLHRKALQAYADQLGVDPLTLRSNAARWKNETPLRPTTTITDEGNSGSYVSMTVYGWTESGTINKWTTGSGLFRFSGDASGQQSWAWHPTSLSSSNNQSSLVNHTSGGSVSACICRGNGGTGPDGTAWSGYILDFYGSAHHCYSVVLGAGTALSSPSASASAPRTFAIKAVGSSITSISSTGASSTVTNTAVTTGLRVGVYGWNTTGTDTFETFTADDFMSSSGSLNSQSIHNQYKRGMLWPTDGM